MKRFAILALFVCGCDWGKFSTSYSVTSNVACTITAGTADRFCDDFETPTANPAWNVNQEGGTIAFDSTQHRSGKQSMHLHVDQAAAGADIDVTLNESQTLSAAPRSFYLRVFVWGDQIQGSYALASVISNGGHYAGLNVGVDPSEKIEMTDWANAWLDGGASYYEVSDATFANSAWSCLEWHVVEAPSGATTGSASVSLNGNELSALSPTTGLVTQPGDVPLGFLTVGVSGATIPGGVGAFDVWFDDLVIDKEPIGCAP